MSRPIQEQRVIVLRPILGRAFLARQSSRLE